jgi:hypothetical protein
MNPLPESAMRKILLPPMVFLLLVACVDNASIVNPGGPTARFDLNTAGEITMTATAQGRVMPAAYAAKMGEINNSWPHANANMRYQQVFLGSELGNTDRIAGLCLRHDELFPGRALTEHLTVKLGPTEMDNTNLSTTFDANYSAAPTEVFSGDIVIPATTGAGTLDSFDFCINFTTQYVHPEGSNLVVEFVNTTPTSRSHPKDACSAGSDGCNTRRVVAFSAAATTATIADNSGLIMSFLSADPTERVDCKDDHWMDYGFKNQGQCVRFVETGKDSRG